jgi:hypothetical protein
MWLRKRLLVALLLAPLPVCAQPTAEGNLSLGGKLVPLPTGAWRILYQAAEPGRSTEGSLSTTTHRALLVQERAGRAAAVIVAHAAAEMGAAWNPHGICVNTNSSVIVRRVEAAIRGNLDCRGLVLIESGRGQSTPQYLNALYDEGERRQGWLPRRWISVQVVQSERMHWMSVEYRFAPSIFGAAAENAANWSDGMRSAEQQAIIQRLDAWSKLAHDGLRRGLYGRTPSTTLPPPG